MNLYNRKKNNNSKIIVIISDWGSRIGFGHVQRMTTLLWYINQKRDAKAFLVLNYIPKFLPKDLVPFVKARIDIQPDLIIRDMRDSTVDEIERLKIFGRVLVIDDNGEGREHADFIIDLLPNPGKSSKESIFISNDIFIYGFSFLQSLIKLKDNIVKKEIDLSIYPGCDVDEEYINFYTYLLPKGSSFAVLKGDNSYLQKGREIHNIGHKSLGEIILSTKVVLSHFGILLYEGFIAGCRLISINPTIYHSKLADMAKGTLNIFNLGVWNNIDKVNASIEIQRIMSDPVCNSISIKEVYIKVITKLEMFYKYLIKLI